MSDEILDPGRYYLYTGPTWLSGEIEYGDILKFVGITFPNFALVQKLGLEKKLVVEVPSAHLAPLIVGAIRASRLSVLVDILKDAKDHYEQVDKEKAMLGDEEIQNRVGFHKATVEGPNATLPRHREIRQDFASFMRFLDWMLPDGRAKDVAMHQLEDASMWAHKSISETAPLVDEEGDAEARRAMYKDETALGRFERVNKINQGSGPSLAEFEESEKVLDDLGPMLDESRLRRAGAGPAWTEFLRLKNDLIEDGIPGYKGQSHLAAAQLMVRQGRMTMQNYIDVMGNDEFAQKFTPAVDPDFRIGGLGDGVAEVDGPQQ